MCLFCVIPPLTGVYFYNLHPVYKVDVLGTVVYKRERDDFFCYGGIPAVGNTSHTHTHTRADTHTLTTVVLK